jgi:hypothetical protein
MRYSKELKDTGIQYGKLPFTGPLFRKALPSLLPLLDSPLESAIHAKNTKWLMEGACFIFNETPWCFFVPLRLGGYFQGIAIEITFHFK